MSVTLTPTVGRHPFEVAVVDSPCLCAQMAPSFCEAMDAGPTLRADPVIVADLAEHADPECLACIGTGIDPNGYDPEGTLEMNFSDANWRVLSRFLGLEPTGRARLARLRRALVRAARMLNDAPIFGAEIEYTEDRSGALGSARYIRGEITADGLAARVTRLAAFLDACEARGATHVMWS